MKAAAAATIAVRRSRIQPVPGQTRVASAMRVVTPRKIKTGR
jgi:hypothetical protein